MQTPRRMRVAVVYGGRSGEHEVSIESARSLVQAMDQQQYEVVPIGITQSGAWLLAEPEVLAAGANDASCRLLPSADPSQRALVPMDGAAHPDAAAMMDRVDVIFPLVHGTFGEDGCLQGLFELAEVPCVGSGVLASAVGMDKTIMKAVFQAHGLPVVRFAPVARTDWERNPATVIASVEGEIGYPCFVKPSNLGSSVGISKVRDREQLSRALDLAAEFSGRLIVEEARDARELECGVLGNHDPETSVVGEVIPAREFYDYEAKYHDPQTRFAIPADISPDVQWEVQALAARAFKAIGGAGMARVDFFMDRADGSLWVNEINTIPGFTSMSVYPRLWAASGVSYPELIDRLVQLALDRHRDQARNRTRYET